MFRFIEKIFLSSKIESLETENRRLKEGLETYKIKCETLHKRLGGERIFGGYCDKCKNLVISQLPGGFPVRSCLLDCKCKDFEHI